jgi:RimJ/RimL family protein N-acetyltransferase
MTSLVDFDLNFSNKSWDWLNDPEIKALTLTPDFTKEEQRNFFNSIPQRKNYWIKGIMENGIPIGAMGLKNINTKEKNAEYWGYIGDKKFWGKGIGKFMIHEANKEAKRIGLHELNLKVGSNNFRAKNLYLNLGFVLSHAGEIEQYVILL